MFIHSSGGPLGSFPPLGWIRVALYLFAHLCSIILGTNMFLPSLHRQPELLYKGGQERFSEEVASWLSPSLLGLHHPDLGLPIVSRLEFVVCSFWVSVCRPSLGCQFSCERGPCLLPSTLARSDVKHLLVSGCLILHPRQSHKTLDRERRCHLSFTDKTDEGKITRPSHTALAG